MPLPPSFRFWSYSLYYICKKTTEKIESPNELNQQQPADTALKPSLSQRHLWIILLANGLFALLANLLFYFDVLGPIRTSPNRWPFIVLGMIVYSIQTVLIYYLVKQYAPTRWLFQPFRGRDWLWGLAMALLVWLAANAVQGYRLPDSFSRLNSTRSFTRFLPIFLFNSIPGALIEEYLFRFLPVQALHQLLHYLYGLA